MSRRIKVLLAGAATTLALAAPAAAENGVTVYPVAHNNPAFTGALDAYGYGETASEDFGRLGQMDDPLSSAGNQVYAPGEIPAGVVFQSNRVEGGEAGPDPVGRFGLAVNAGPTSNWPGAEQGPNQLRTPTGGSSLDILVDPDRFTGLRLQAPVAGRLRVFDEAGRLLHSEFLRDQYPGVLAQPGTRIGRINVSVTQPEDFHGLYGDEYIADVHLYGPAA